MLPSRGLRPHQMVPSASRHSSSVRSGASRKFSSVPRRAGLSTLPYRTSPLRSACWRTGATSSSNVLLSVSSVRYGSWYAPWSWGRSSTPSDVTPTTTSSAELAAEPVPEPAVTSATPELAPAGIDKPAVVDSTASPANPQTVEDLLGLDPTPATDAVPLVDPGATISYSGNLKDLGLDYGWGTSALFENLVELSYLYSGLGWSGSIALSAVAIRCGLFFFQYQGSDAGARLAAMKPVLQPLMDEMEAAKRAGNEDKVMACKMKQKAIMGEFGGALWKSLSTPVLQMMLGFGAFRCLRGMTTLPVPGMTTEGWLWFTDLTVADPYYILPMATGGIMYAIIKNGGETGMNTEVQQAGWQKQMMVVMPLMMVIVTSFQPAGLQLYFVCSAVLGGVTSQLLRTPAFRRLTGLRQLPSQQSNAVYNKVVKGEIKLSALRGSDGKIRYQAPGNSRSSSTSSKNAPSTASYATTTPGINIKPGITLPPHMRAAAPAKVPQNYADRAHDFEQGAPVGSLSAKVDWFRRNYTPKFIWRRMKRSIMKDSRTASEMMEQDRKKKAREATRRYEIERKRRMEGR